MVTGQDFLSTSLMQVVSATKTDFHRFTVVQLDEVNRLAAKQVCGVSGCAIHNNNSLKRSSSFHRLVVVNQVTRLKK